MKFNRALVALATSALFVGAAGAAELTPVQIDGATFVDALIGQITISKTSDITGFVYALDTVSADFDPSLTFSLQKVDFLNGGIKTLQDLDLSNAGFSFKNVSAGTYAVVASGNLVGAADYTETAFIGATYNVTPSIPEPETYALMLAGLSAVAFVARRRSAS